MALKGVPYISVKLTPEVRKKLKVISAQKGTTVQDVVFSLICDYLSSDKTAA